MPQSDRTCCGVIKETRYQYRQRRRNKPQPWILLKFTVGLSFAIVGYTVYVYAGRFCKDMIARSSGALADPATGVVFLVVFGVLLFLVMWSYILVVITSPGRAPDYTKQTERPGYDHRQNNIHRPSLNSEDIRGPSYELMAPTVDLSRQLTHETDTQSKDGSQKRGSQSSPESGKSRRGASLAASSITRMERDPEGTVTKTREGHVTDVHGPPAAPQVSNPAVPPAYTNAREPSLDLPPPMYSRRPPTTPVLLPEYRYCNRCKIIKPPRAHHCRACGTCVLKYDHHCPWVGHCIGAFNQKYFVNFLQWGTVFCCWTFATLLGFTIKAQTSKSAPTLDPQQIVVIVLTFVFGMFCFLMLITQSFLVLSNETTVESISSRSMREREHTTLSHMHRWYEIGAKRRTRQQWDNEWGRIGKEGNLWWLGSSRANWEAVMGKNKWWWFLPVGRCLDDGMSYPVNPRFDSQGRWRRRKEWPSGQ